MRCNPKQAVLVACVAAALMVFALMGRHQGHEDSERLLADLYTDLCHTPAHPVYVLERHREAFGEAAEDRLEKNLGIPRDHWANLHDHRWGTAFAVLKDPGRADWAYAADMTQEEADDMIRYLCFRIMASLFQRAGYVSDYYDCFKALETYPSEAMASNGDALQRAVEFLLTCGELEPASRAQEFVIFRLEEYWAYKTAAEHLARAAPGGYRAQLGSGPDERPRDSFLSMLAKEADAGRPAAALLLLDYAAPEAKPTEDEIARYTAARDAWRQSILARRTEWEPLAQRAAELPLASEGR